VAVSLAPTAFSASVIESSSAKIQAIVPSSALTRRLPARCRSDRPVTFRSTAAHRAAEMSSKSPALAPLTLSLKITSRELDAPFGERNCGLSTKPAHVRSTL